jgi:hypothetical protein
MPVLSPDARHVLAGVGSGRIRIDNQIPPGLAGLAAGGWAWMTNDVVVGNGSPDGTDVWSSWGYRISTGELFQVDGRPASATFGGGGVWVSYLAARPTVFSFDSLGRTLSAKVARSCSPTGMALFTSHEADVMYWADQELHGVAVASAQIGYENIILWCDAGLRLRAYGIAVPVCPASGGMGARFTQGWICQWNNALNALVIYPWQTVGPLQGYVLSADAHDFNHDIGTRDDGMVVVCTGINQGETEVRYYEIDLTGKRQRVNGGPWQGLLLADMDPGVGPHPDDPTIPPSTPIVSFPGYQPTPQASYGRPGYCGPYFATDLRTGNFKTPGNTEAVVNGTVLGGNQQVDRKVFVSLQSTGNDPDKMFGFLSGGNDDSMGNAGIKGCWNWHKGHGHPSSAIVRYYDSTPIPADFIAACEREAIVQVQCYPRAGESTAQSMARFTESVDRVIQSGRKAGIARAFNTKFGSLRQVLDVQDPLCAMVRSRPAVILDLWFSHGRWYGGVESGAAYCAELLMWESVLAGLFTGLP